MLIFWFGYDELNVRIKNYTPLIEGNFNSF